MLNLKLYFTKHKDNALIVRSKENTLTKKKQLSGFKDTWSICPLLSKKNNLALSKSLKFMNINKKDQITDNY